MRTERRFGPAARAGCGPHAPSRACQLRLSRDGAERRGEESLSLPTCGLFVWDDVEGVRVGGRGAGRVGPGEKGPSSISRMASEEEQHDGRFI